MMRGGGDGRSMRAFLETRQSLEAVRSSVPLDRLVGQTTGTVKNSFATWQHLNTCVDLSLQTSIAREDLMRLGHFHYELVNRGPDPRQTAGPNGKP